MRAENLGGKKWKVEVERNVKISNKEISDGIEFLESFNDKILKKWDIYFSGKQPRFEQITRIPKKGSKKSK